MDKVAEYIEISVKKYSPEFIVESKDSVSMEVQESEDLIKESKNAISEAAAVDFITATRLADNEYKKNLALNKSRDEGRLAGLKVAKTFLSKRKAQEQNPAEKTIYTQKIAHLDVDIAKLNLVVKKTPKPGTPGAPKINKPGEVPPANPPTGRF